MSVSSLTKFTVPIDGDQSAASQGLLMPKLKYRFRASFENFGVSTPRTEMTKQVMNITRPSVTFEENMIETENIENLGHKTCHHIDFFRNFSWLGTG